MSDSLPYFPLVGAVIGLLVTAIAWIVGGKFGWPLGAGILCVASTSFITRGLHLDGLADVFDSLGAGTIIRRLEIMKDPRIGSFGVVALTIVLVMKFVAIARLAGAGQYLLLAVPFVLSRAMQVHLIVTLPYARAEGGIGWSFVEGSTMYHFIISYVVALMLCFVFGNVIGVVVAVATCLCTSLLAQWMRSMFGGVTGDLVGMGSELVESIVLVTLSFVI